jgi:CheY-like chemotaxis protein
MTGPEAKRVLIVDDERVITDTLVTIFSQAEYSARGAYSAEQALATLEEWRPELVIIDVILPAMNGIDLAIHIKALYPDCRVSLFSAQAATADLLDSAVNEGHSFEVFAKPIHPSELLGVAGRHFTQGLAGVDPRDN